MNADSEVFARIRDSLATALELDDFEVKSVDMDTTALDLEKWTSVSHQALILEIEGRFGFEFDVLEIADLISMEALVRTVEDRLK